MATKPSWTVVTQRLKFFARESFLSSLLSFPEEGIHSGDFHEFLMSSFGNGNQSHEKREKLGTKHYEVEIKYFLFDYVISFIIHTYKVPISKILEILAFNV